VVRKRAHQGGVRFDGIVGNYASPYAAGSGYVLLHPMFAKVNARRAWGLRSAAWGDHPGHGQAAASAAGIRVASPVREVL